MGCHTGHPLAETQMSKESAAICAKVGFPCGTLTDGTCWSTSGGSSHGLCFFSDVALF